MDHEVRDDESLALDHLLEKDRGILDILEVVGTSGEMGYRNDSSQGEGDCCSKKILSDACSEHTVAPARAWFEVNRCINR
jgi:hypothetical protein